MSIKRLIWFPMLGVICLGLIGASTCGKDAQMRIDAAKDAVEEARDAGAPEYAPVEYRSAEEYLLQAQEEFDRARYQRAESTAMQSEAQARLALEKALEKKRAAEEEEERLRKAREEEENAAVGYNVSSLYSDTIQDAPTDEEAARAALHDIHFDFDSSEISEHAKTIIAMNAKWLSEHPNVKVEIEGHCDERGTDEYNLALGARRAKSVSDYMVTLGVSPSRLQTISYGEAQPVDPGHTEAAWQKNRRVHFAVIR